MIERRREFGKTDVTYLFSLLSPTDRGESLSTDEQLAAKSLLAEKVLKNPIFTEDAEATVHCLYSCNFKTV